MGHPTLKTKGATLINLALLLVIFLVHCCKHLI